jgi:nucleoside phosphorylase
MVECNLLRTRREHRAQSGGLREYRDVAICMCTSYRGRRRRSIAKTILFGAGAATGLATIAFATGGLGLVGAAIATKIALATGATSALAFGGAGNLPSRLRFDDYVRGELLNRFETEEPLTDWIAQPVRN